MNGGMSSVGAPIAPIASENLSVKINNSYKKFKKKAKKENYGKYKYNNI